jgi:uncharacterized repeat protein (TIGR03803 family)
MCISLDRRRRNIVGLLLFGLLFSATSSRAQVYEVLSSFRGCTATNACTADSDGAHPRTVLVAGPDGDLYGTTSFDTSLDMPAVLYRVSPDGTRANIASFQQISGTSYCDPFGRLAFGTDGALYGLARGCGNFNGGILFRLMAGSLTVVHDFTTTPSAGLARGMDGKLYGATSANGTIAGFIFRWDGTLSIVQSGSSAMGDLSLGAEGNFYSVRVDRVYLDLFNAVPQGWIDRLHPVQGMSSVFQFDLRENPTLGVLPASDGYLYGSTMGLNGSNGWLYKVGPNGFRTNLYDFGLFGANPTLAEGLNGAIYGTAVGGAFSAGTIFRLLPDGNLSTLHTFQRLDYSGGHSPNSGLTRGVDGHWYGTTFYGGEHDLGVVFRLRMSAEADITANGRQGPLTLRAGDPLQISAAFHGGETSVQTEAEVYVAVVTPWGAAYWLQPDQTFGELPTRLYAGALRSFAAVPIVDVPFAGLLPAGDYYWVMIVDADNNGAPDGTYVDYVRTMRR